jgi:hypothetical protein
MSGELPKFNINYIKTKPIDWKTLEESYICTPEDIEFSYNPFSIQKIQNYNPIYNEYFSLTDSNYNSISLNHKYHFIDTTTVIDIEKKQTVQQPVFIKYSPLLDPYRFMTGKYKNNSGTNILPAYKKELYIDGEPIYKIMDFNNASYIDNFFCFLSSKFMNQHQFAHGVDYYGSWLGIQDIFKVNITDDIEFLQSSEYYLENTNKLFSVTKLEGESEFLNFGSRSNKTKLCFLNDTKKSHNISAISLGALDIENNDEFQENDENISSNPPVIYEKEITNNNLHISTDSSDGSEDDSDIECSDEDESDDIIEEDCSEDYDDDFEDESDDENNSEDTNRFAFIKQFPIQMICLEKCDGTLDKLFVNNEVDEKIAASALFQIIMTLIAYQKSFNFTHNDLHTNNIMFSNTEKKFLYYYYKNKTYRVPTYGKIFKIIDFGRSIYKFNGHLFCSDSFAVGGDASTQYNTEPYMNENKTRLDPNYSFDLCRLGCSIYDFIIDDDDPTTLEKFNELQKTVYRWCTNDEGKNMLYKRNGEERYPNFKLYKMIAKSVHKHTPEEQLKFPFFKQFLLKKAIKTPELMNLDVLPSYVK